MIVILYVFTIIYCFLILRLYSSWKKIPQITPGKNQYDSLPFFSVLIPVRNESENILFLLNDLDRQDLPKDKFEVIIIDDDSTDGTLQLVQDHQQDFKFELKIFQLNVEPHFSGSHKKMALALGIENSRGEYIMTTDGDCRVSHSWISSLGSFLQENNLLCVTGPVKFQKFDSLFQDLQMLEFAYLIGTGAASLNIGFPNMCNGANLAFSKRAFYSVGGYKGNTHIPSGDDEFLMHKIYAEYPGKVRFLKSQDYIVTTRAKNNLKSLFFQRRRWAGKWKMYKDVKISLFAAFYFLYNLLFVVAFVMVLMDIFPVGVFLIQTFLRVFVDWVFLRKIMKFLMNKFSIPLFLFAEIIYPFYVLVLGIAANFGYYEWKGRKVK